MILDIPKRIESGNLYRNWHWSKKGGNSKTSEKVNWYWLIRSALGSREIQPYKEGYVLSFRPTAKLLDDDNLRAGAKPLVDALVDAGLLKGDDKKSCKLHYYQHKKIREEKTLIYFPEYINAEN